MQWFETKTPKVQYNFVPGYGWIETAAQGNRQIEAYRRRIEGTGSNHTDSNHSSSTRSTHRGRSPAVLTASDFLNAIRHSDYQRASQTIASDVVMQTAVSGLLNAQAQRTVKDDEQLWFELQSYYEAGQTARQLEQLLAGIDPGAIQRVRRLRDRFTILMGLDPYQQESFQTGWSNLSDNAKTWPLSRFKRSQFEIVRGSSLSTEELQRGKTLGIRADSLAWLDEFASSTRR